MTPTQLIIAFLTLTALEIVLGIDNVIFIAILSSKLPEHQQARGRQIGIAIAVVSRLLLLLTITLIVTRLTAELIFGFSGRDLILIIGGLFLIGKSTFEIHEKLEGLENGHGDVTGTATMRAVLTQIVLVDVVFSLDSVITAVGIVGGDGFVQIAVMATAVIIAAAVMVLFANTIAHFVERHPTFKILALAFLILIGSILVIEGVNPELAHELHIKNYVYFAMAFSVVIEFLNLRLRKTAEPVKLKKRPELPA